MSSHRVTETSSVVGDSSQGNGELNDMLAGDQLLCLSQWTQMWNPDSKGAGIWSNLLFIQMKKRDPSCTYTLGTCRVAVSERGRESRMLSRGRRM